MEAASSVCDTSDFPTIGASEIIDNGTINVPFPASASSCSSDSLMRQCSSVSSASSHVTSHKVQLIINLFNLLVFKSFCLFVLKSFYG